MWIIDLGASQHMTGDEELLYDVKEGRGHMVTFGNNEVVQISRVGKIVSFHSPYCLASTFSTGDACLVPPMHKSLLSIN